MQANGDWKAAATILSNAAQQLEAAGADCFAICTHEVFDEVCEDARLTYR